MTTQTEDNLRLEDLKRRLRESEQRCEDLEANLCEIRDEHREALKKIEREQAVLRFFQEQTNDGWWDWYPLEEREYMSPRFWDKLGINASREHSPKAWGELMYPEDGEVATVAFQKHQESKGNIPYRQEIRFHRLDGGTSTLLCCGSIVESNESGVATRVMGTLTDNGCGSDEGLEEKIFGIFKTLQPKGADTGSGIGLAVCRKVMELHEGQIWAEASPQGAVFRFSIPQKTNATPASARLG